MIVLERFGDTDELTHADILPLNDDDGVDDGSVLVVIDTRVDIDNVVTVLGEGEIREDNEELDDKVCDLVTKGVVETVREPRVETDDEMLEEVEREANTVRVIVSAPVCVTERSGDPDADDVTHTDFETRGD